MKLTKNNPIVKVTESLNKSGRIKGKNKKETKVLRAICGHHKINKKGKLKPQIYNNGTGECTCELCERTFRTKLFTDEMVNEIIDNAMELADQGEFIAISTDAGEEAVNAFAEFKVALINLGKAYRRVRQLAQKQDKIKNKNRRGKDGRNDKDSSAAYGGWN